MNGRNGRHRRQTGLSYVEMLVVVVVIGLSLVPIMSALQGAVEGAGADTEGGAAHLRMVGKLEEVLAQPFLVLVSNARGQGTSTIYSDPASSADRRLVFISAYDGDNADADNDPFTGTDPGLLWVRVEVEGTGQWLSALQTNR